MRGIVIAAGLGSRMAPLTDFQPKCMLPIAGRPLLHHTLDRLTAAGCEELVVVVGYCADAIDAQGATLVHNTDYRNNNILHSLMKARAYLDGPTICTYSDIWVEPDIYAQLMATDGDVVLAVDRDWRAYYEGRTDHPIGEAENVYYDAGGRIKKIGKHLTDAAPDDHVTGEFLGLWRMTEAGTRSFVDCFDELDRTLEPSAPFQAARKWTQSYVTDMLQELINWGYCIDCALTARGWAELDTLQDYHRLPSIAARQRMTSLSKFVGTGMGLAI